jgi:hypothetical protein
VKGLMTLLHSTLVNEHTVVQKKKSYELKLKCNLLTFLHRILLKTVLSEMYVGIINYLLHVLISRVWYSRCKFLHQANSLLAFIHVAVFQYGTCQLSGKIYGIIILCNPMRS